VLILLIDFCSLLCRVKVNVVSVEPVPTNAFVSTIIFGTRMFVKMQIAPVQKANSMQTNKQINKY